MNNYNSIKNDYSDPETVERAERLNPVLRSLHGLPNIPQGDPSLIRLLTHNNYDPRTDIEFWPDKA